MQKFSRKYSNREYAPGLALYGVDGKDGVSGESGRSLFVCQYNIDDNEEAGKFGNAINQGLDMTSNDNSVIGRPYMNGDVFIFSTGYLYRIDDYDAISTLGGQLTAAKFQEYMSVVGVIKITEASEIFSENTNRLVLDTEHYKGFIVNMSSVSETDLGTINSPLTVISDNETRDGRIYFMGLKSIYAGSSDARLSIYYDTDNNAYVIDSDKDVLIDADVRISSQGDDNVYDDFSKPLLTGSDMSLTSFGGLCNHLSWNIENANSIYYRPDDNVQNTNEIYMYSKIETGGRFTDEGGQKKIIRDDNYEVRLFYLNRDGKKTDYIKICIIRQYNNQNSNENTDTDTTLEFDFSYAFTNGQVLYNGSNFVAPQSGYVELRNPLKIGSDPQLWADYWWKNVKKEEPVYPLTYWYALTFFTPDDEKIFLPSEMDWLIVTAPKNVYVIVYGDGSELHPVDMSIEQSKIEFISGEGENKENISQISFRTGYDLFAFMTPRYKRTFTFKANDVISEKDKYDIFKKSSFHIAGICNRGLKEGQRIMEYYIKNSEDSYPYPENPKTVDVYGDYPDGSIDWYVSVIGDNYTEFFIKEE